MISRRHMLSRLSPTALLDWRLGNFPTTSTANLRKYVSVGGRDLILNSRRRGSQSQAPPPLEARDILLRMHHNLDVDTL